ncbi:glutathione S-transferase family protein [Hoeflea olei]|uniref:Glutathione S-transferase n=1 Tax=Hoeflea olei TaxID=1480615 RepID=A0A1C1YYW2_9HYPH|nr:glutathione S-transferase family protein [Hoeflea olei]OCW58754.1 hypothetical protein AWJ14_00570 [Hoeflea olei]
MSDPQAPADPGLPVLIGADYSVYTRICRLALRLKGVPHAFEQLDVFGPGGADKARAAGQPFGRIPVLRHGALRLYETLAITRYVDEAFDGPPLQPSSPPDRARMNQIVSIVDTGVYPAIVWGLHVPVSEGREPAAGSMARAQTVLDALEALAGAPWLMGPRPTLADCYLAGAMGYVLESPAAPAVTQSCPRLAAWWSHAEARLPLTREGYGVHPER